MDKKNWEKENNIDRKENKHLSIKLHSCLEIKIRIKKKSKRSKEIGKKIVLNRKKQSLNRKQPHRWNKAHDDTQCHTNFF